MQNPLDFQGLLEAAPDAMVGTDQAGVIRFVNRQTELLFDYDRTDLVGQPMDILVPESVRKGHPAHRVRTPASSSVTSGSSNTTGPPPRPNSSSSRRAASLPIST